ncbi:MAG: hypothetical protein VKK04_01215 [Synechococcales bacterium]|nr:hypothetical protein [Synechococcales bacterium]
MNQGDFRGLQINLSGLSFWLTIIAVVWLLGSIGLGWLVKSVFILFGLLLLAPIVAFIGFRWWLQRNLVEDQCPVCRHEFVGLNGTQLRCPSCSEPIKVEKGHFNRLTPPGTVDVDVVDVSAQDVRD